MDLAFYALIAVGGVACLAGAVWFLMVAFATSRGWGVACLLFPPSGLVFLAKHWAETRLAFAVNLSGTILLTVGVAGLAAYTSTAAVGSIAADVARDRGADPFTMPARRDLPAAAAPATAAPVAPAVPTATALPQATAPPTPAAEALPTLVPDLDEDLTAAPAAAPSAGDAVDRADLPALVGTAVAIRTTEGKLIKAVLLAVGDDGVKVNQRIGAGHVVYFLEWAKVADVRPRR